MQTEAVKYCKNLMFLLGTEEKVKLIENSNLNEREKQIVALRFVIGSKCGKATYKVRLIVLYTKI